MLDTPHIEISCNNHHSQRYTCLGCTHTHFYVHMTKHPWVPLHKNASISYMLYIKWELKHTKTIAPSRNYIRDIVFSSSARYHQQHGIITHCIMLKHVQKWYLSQHGKSSFHMLDLICRRIYANMSKESYFEYWYFVFNYGNW